MIMVMAYFSKKARDERKYQSTVQKGTKFLATEHYFFEKLTDDLSELKDDLENAKTALQDKTIADMKKAFHDFRYIGKAEKRFERIEEHIEDALRAIEKKVTVKGTIKEIDELRKRLHTESADLIRSSSLYEGKIRKYLTDLRDLVTKSKKEEAEALLQEIEQAIEQTERWIAALASDLNNAKKLHTASIDASDNERLAQECSERKDFIQSAQFYLKAGKPKLALRVLEKIPEAQHESLNYYDLMQRAHYQLKEYQNAARYHLLGSKRHINQVASGKKWSNLRDTTQRIARTLQGPRRKFDLSLRAPKSAWEKLIKLVNDRDITKLLEPKAKAWMIGYSSWVLGDKVTAASKFEEAGDTQSAETVKPKKK